MSLSGSLEDVTVADVIQFVYLGRRTGTLTLHYRSREARIGFHEGDIVHARVTGSPRLGEILVERGLIDQSAVDQMVERQKSGESRSMIGDLLIDGGLIEEGNIRRALVDITRQTILSLFTWPGGTFEFTGGAPTGYASVEAMANDERLFRLKIRTESVLLEAARFLDESFGGLTQAIDFIEPHKSDSIDVQFDETGGEGLEITLTASERRTIRNTDALDVVRQDSGDDETREMSRADIESRLKKAAWKLTEQEAAAALAEHACSAELSPEFRAFEDGVRIALDTVAGDATLTILTHDQELADAIEAGIGTHSGLKRALERPNNRWLIIDVRDGQEPFTTIERSAGSNLYAGVLAMIDDVAAAARAYEYGATAAVSAAPEEVVSFLATLVHRSEKVLSRGPSGRVTQALSRLKRTLTELRMEAASTNATLTLMKLISESVERAVIFSVTEVGLRSVGAFGLGAAEQPLAKAFSSLTYSPEDLGAIGLTATDGKLRLLKQSEADLPETLSEILGTPRHDEVIILPIRGVSHILAVVYADNGEKQRPIADIDILEIAGGQIGVALENDILRRRLVEAEAD